MIAPKFPDNESERLEAVKSYKLLDTLPEKNFDNITALASAICDTPISLVTLLDFKRNFLKSHHGISFNESPREISFCGHAILDENDIFIVEDSTKDERFHDNPIVTEFNAHFYAGVSLKTPDGLPLGTLCVYDTKSRVLTDLQKNALISLARQVENLFELHSSNLQLLDMQTELEERNSHLKKFANVVSHDLKSPLANIMSLTELVKIENQNNLSNDSYQYLNFIEESSENLKNYIDAILKYYKTDELLKQKKENVSLNDIFKEIQDMLIINDINFTYPKEGIVKNINKASLSQILLNLIDNAFKYNTKASPKVTVKYKEDSEYHVFHIEDNGIGIEENKQKNIFNLFQTIGIKDKNGKNGTGVGLSTVKNLVTKLNGTISLQSEINVGTTFKFTIKK